MRQIQLTQNKFTLVDDDVYEWAKNYNWYALKGKNTFYAVRNISAKNSPDGKRHLILLHNFIMNTPKGLDTDHIDGDGLNNQRDNLRIVTNRQNGQNKIQHREGKLVGAYLQKKIYKDKIYFGYRSQIVINSKIKYLGYFKTEQEAHEAYLKALNETK